MAAPEFFLAPSPSEDRLLFFPMASKPCYFHQQTAHRRSELQAMYARFEAEIEQLNQRVLEQAGQRPTAGLLMTHPGVGPITAPATDVLLGDPKRFSDGKALASYIGIIPREHSSGGRQRLGGVSKQGKPRTREGNRHRSNKGVKGERGGVLCERHRRG
jgi:transposase